ncbi:MAG: hypothetical protein Q8P32_04175 [Candidatus Komeilibacteria bacterium]|nr:hypothetical protein [Candidatus Komeilibacteria bacterium]
MSNFLKKSFLISVMVLTVVSTVGVALTPSVAQAATAGDLIKTDTVSAVYYLDSNLKRHPFHHANQYFTWFSDFSLVKTIPTSEMSGYDLGSTIVVRPGTKLVQFVSLKADGGFDVDDPKVYAVSSNGSIMHVDSAATAVKFWGSAWETMILGLPNFLFGYYTPGAQVTSSSMYPTGSLVKMADSSQVYYIDGSSKRPVTDAGFTANRFNMAFVVTASDLSAYASGSSVTSMESALANPVGGTVVEPPVTGTGLTVALAADTPGAQLAPGGATNVPLMKFNLTASADGAITVSSINIKRLGPGTTAQYTGLYLYEGANRLTNAKTLNSTTHVAQFVNLGLSVSAGTTRTLTLSADMATSVATYAGQVSYFQLASADITSSATINGSFPLTSNTVTFGSVSSGSIKVEKDGTLSNPSVGQMNAKIAQFKLTAGTGEDLSVRRISLYETGTMNNSYLSNLKLYQNTTLVASTASATDKGYVVFDFATPYTLSKNTNKIFHVTADISGSARNSDTVRTYIDQTTDVYAVGANYGYGASVDIGATAGTYDGTSTNYSEVTVQGGQVTVAMNGPVAGTLAVGATGVTLMNFSVNSAVNAEIRSLRIELHNDGGDGDDLNAAVIDGDAATDAATALCANDYIYNVKVVDVDNGESTSSVDCSGFSNIDATNGDGVYHAFTDYFTLTAGVTRNFAIKADLHASLDADDYFAILGSGDTTFYTFSSTAIKNTDNNQWATDIVPSTQTQGNTQTVAAAGLRVSRASNAVGTTVIQGTSKVTLAEFAINALDGSDVTISGMTMYGYVDGNGAGTAASGTMSLGSDDLVREAGMGAVGTVYANNLVTNFRIYNKSADAALSTNLNSSVESMSSAGAVTFSNINWTVPAGETRVLAVVADVTASAFENGDTGAAGTLGMEKYVKVNFGDNAGITAVDDSNNSVTMTDSAGNAFTCVDANGTGDTCGTGVAAGLYAETSDAYIAIAASGTINVTAEGNPVIANVVAGTSMVPMMNLKFSASDEAFNVNKFRISQSQGTNGNRAVDSVTISYQNQAGQTVAATQPEIGGNADFVITANPLYVPANSDRIVNVYFDVPAINQNTATYSGDMIKATFDFDTNFEARGVGNSSSNKTSTSGSNVVGNTMTVHGALPTLTAEESSSALAAGTVELLRFAVEAREGGTTVNLKKLTFELSMTDASTDTSTLYLKSFKIFEGESYESAAANELTRGDTGDATYQIYNGWGATGTSAGSDGLSGGKLSADDARIYQNVAISAGIDGAGNSSSTHKIILVFNDDRPISSGDSMYYIMKATADNVDSGDTGDSITTKIISDNGDTTTTSSKFLEAFCDGTGTKNRPGKYCLSTGPGKDAAAGETGAYIIWSDTTGTNGTTTHADISGAGSTTGDWFNGYKLRILGQRTLN